MVMIAAVVTSFITNGGRSAWFIGALQLCNRAIFPMTLYMVRPARTARSRALARTGARLAGLHRIAI
jgi:hypothetical protein